MQIIRLEPNGLINLKCCDAYVHLHFVLFFAIIQIKH